MHLFCCKRGSRPECTRRLRAKYTNREDYQKSKIQSLRKPRLWPGSYYISMIMMIIMYYALRILCWLKMWVDFSVFPKSVMIIQWTSDIVIWIYQLSWKCKLATVTSWKADVSNVSPSSERMKTYICKTCTWYSNCNHRWRKRYGFLRSKG